MSKKTDALQCVFLINNIIKIGLALFCPITSHIKGYPFEIVLNDHSISGCILSDQIKNLDWKQRNCSFIEKAAAEEIESAVHNIKSMIE